MDTNLTAINNALFAPVIQEEAPAAEDSGIVDVDPDDYDTLGRETDEYDDEDSEYDEWIENTYYMDDEASLLKELMDKLDDTITCLDDEDHRFYNEDYHRINDMINHLSDKIKELHNYVIGNYSTY